MIIIQLTAIRMVNFKFFTLILKVSHLYLGGTMKNLIFNTTIVFQSFVFILVLYYLIISIFGIFKPSNKNIHNPKKSFALLVAAHNEEKVIGKIIESLQEQKYPRNLFDIFIIADNCSDNTAKIAKEYNVNVFERLNNKERGKGYALQWMFDKIFKMSKKYDAIGIFDADNVVSKNFLSEINSKMLEGNEVVQGYIDSKNPHDSWITECYSVSFWSSNRLFQLGRSNLHLSNQIGGTGFVVSSHLIKEIGWNATCLTEDLEFTCKLILNNYKVAWCHDAIVYDEKPLSLKQSWRQRTRWMQGFTDVTSRFFIKLIKKAIKERSFICFDCALYVIQPFITLLIGLSYLLTLLQNITVNGLHIFTIECLFPVILWKFFSLFQYILTPFVLFLEKKVPKKIFYLLCLFSLNIFIFDYFLEGSDSILSVLLVHIIYLAMFISLTYLLLAKKQFKIFLWYQLYSIYTLTWIPITLQGILMRKNKEWNHTEHIRQIGISEV